MRENRCDHYRESECDDRNERDCDIKSICCSGFVKEKFSLRATATVGGVVVYRNSNDITVTGTVKLINLSERTITLDVDNRQILVAPNSSGAITALNIDHVTIRVAQGSARALLCFDIQVPSGD